MARASRNPRGYSPGQTVVVKVGRNGTLTHFFDQERGRTLCGSGAHLSHKGQEFFPAYARGPQVGTVDTSRPAKVTCYRCVKLASLNVADGRDPWQRA